MSFSLTRHVLVLLRQQGTGATVNDSSPNAFSFSDQGGVALSSVITSAPITIAGINVAASISVSGGSYSINGGAFTTTPGTVVNGDQVRARHTSSASSGVAVNTTVTIGGISDVFTSTTTGGAGLTDILDELGAALFDELGAAITTES